MNFVYAPRGYITISLYLSIYIYIYLYCIIYTRRTQWTAFRAHHDRVPDDTPRSEYIHVCIRFWKKKKIENEKEKCYFLSSRRL